MTQSDAAEIQFGIDVQTLSRIQRDHLMFHQARALDRALAYIHEHRLTYVGPSEPIAVDTMRPAFRHRLRLFAMKWSSPEVWRRALRYRLGLRT